MAAENMSLFTSDLIRPCVKDQTVAQNMSNEKPGSLMRWACKHLDDSLPYKIPSKTVEIMAALSNGMFGAIKMINELEQDEH